MALFIFELKNFYINNSLICYTSSIEIQSK